MKFILFMMNISHMYHTNNYSHFSCYWFLNINEEIKIKIKECDESLKTTEEFAFFNNIWLKKHWFMKISARSIYMKKIV